LYLTPVYHELREAAKGRIPAFNEKRESVLLGDRRGCRGKRKN